MPKRDFFCCNKKTHTPYSRPSVRPIEQDIDGRIMTPEEGFERIPLESGEYIAPVASHIKNPSPRKAESGFEEFDNKLKR